jgi:hypothetical protein
MGPSGQSRFEYRGVAFKFIDEAFDNGAIGDWELSYREMP